jgi:hypothetical protein
MCRASIPRGDYEGREPPRPRGAAARAAAGARSRAPAERDFRAALRARRPARRQPGARGAGARVRASRPARRGAGALLPRAQPLLAGRLPRGVRDPELGARAFPRHGRPGRRGALLQPARHHPRAALGLRPRARDVRDRPEGISPGRGSHVAGARVVQHRQRGDPARRFLRGARALRPGARPAPRGGRHRGRGLRPEQRGVRPHPACAAVAHRGRCDELPARGRGCAAPARPRARHRPPVRLPASAGGLPADHGRGLPGDVASRGGSRHGRRVPPARARVERQVDRRLRDVVHGRDSLPARPPRRSDRIARDGARGVRHPRLPRREGARAAHPLPSARGHGQPHPGPG